MNEVTNAIRLEALNAIVALGTIRDRSAALSAADARYVERETDLAQAALHRLLEAVAVIEEQRH